MKIHRFTTLYLLFFFLSISVFAQKTPHIKGKVFVDINTGLFQCDFTLSNLESLEEYSILINKGMNIKAFQDVHQETKDAGS